MPAFYICRDLDGISIQAEALFCGEDIFVVISGGDRPHIGAVSLAASLPSLKDPDRLTVSPSLLTVPGHKESHLALSAAEKLARNLNTTVVVSVGIHVDQTNKEEIRKIELGVNKLVDDLEIKLKDNLNIVQ